LEVSLPSTAAGWHRRILILTWPVILANLTIPLVGVADVAVMGRLPDPKYIGAVAVGSAIFSALYWVFSFLRTGTTGIVAQSFGSGDSQMVVGTFVRAALIATVLGVTIVLLQWPISALMFTIFEASNEVESLAAAYYDIRVFGAPGLLIYLAEMGLLFGLQRMRSTLVLSIGLNITNLVLDVFLVLGLGLGVEGVAIGTVVSEWGAAALGMWLVIRAVRTAGFDWEIPAGIWQREKVEQLFHVGSNLILRTFFVQLPFFFGTLLAAGLGDVTLALHGVLMQLFFIMTYGIDGFSHTAETLAGFAFGQRDRPQLRQSSFYSAFWGVVVALGVGSAYFLFGTTYVAWLSTSAEVQAAAVDILPWLLIAPVVCVGAFIFDGIFIGTTHIVEMRNSMVMAALIWAAVLALTFEPLGYHGIWLSMIVFMAARTVLMWIYYPRVERNAAFSS